MRLLRDQRIHRPTAYYTSLLSLSLLFTFFKSFSVRDARIPINSGVTDTDCTYIVCPQKRTSRDEEPLAPA